MLTDVADPVSISEASRVVGDKLIDGSLNLIINNAAINGSAVNNGNNPPGTLAVTGKKEMVDLFVTNAVGPMLIAKVDTVHALLHEVLQKTRLLFYCFIVYLLPSQECC